MERRATPFGRSVPSWRKKRPEQATHRIVSGTRRQPKVMLPVASPVVPEDDSTVEERLAIRLIRRFEEVAHVERLEPPGSVPTPDWRVTTADGRMADVEVIWATNEAGRGFESQFYVEKTDETGRRRRCRREWPDARLSWMWDVRVYAQTGSVSRKQTAKKLVKDLIPVLAEVEAEGGTPEEMARKAHNKLYDPASPCRVRVRRPPSRSSQADDGMVRTSAVPLNPVFGEYEHMLSTVQKCINAKTSKRQMENAPSLRWLFVVLDDNMAAVQLDDYFGPACLELDASERCPFHVLDKLAFDYFDEVWVTGRAFQSRDHIVLRLFKSGVNPEHKVVESIKTEALS